MANVGTLTTVLEAETASFQRGFTKAERSLNSSATKMNRALGKIDRGVAKVRRGIARWGKSLFSIRGAIGVAFGGAGVGLLVNRSLKAADAIGKVADSIGISTSALQELRFAAGQSGVAVQVFDSAMTAFAKRVGEARANTGTLITILRQMDEELLKNVQAARSTDQAFELIINKGRELGNQLDRAALFAAAFGRTAGVQMTNLIRPAADSIGALRSQAASLGIVIDETLIRKSETATDKLSILSQVIQAKLTVAVIENAEELSLLADSFTRLSISAVKAFGDIARAIGLAAPRLVDLQTELERLERLGSDRLLGFLGQSSRFAEEAGKVRLEIEKTIQATNAAVRLASPLVPVGGAPAPLDVPPPAKLVRFLPSGARFAADEARSIRAIDTAMDKLSANAARTATRMDELKSAGLAVFEETRTPLEDFTNRMTELDTLLAAGAIKWNTYARATSLAKDKLAGVERGVINVEAAGRDMAQVLATSFQSMVTNIDSAADALGFLALSLQRVILTAAFKPAEDKLGGLFSSVLKGIAGLFAPAATGGGIVTQPIPARHGRLFQVGRTGGPDSQLVTFAATPGERFLAIPPGEGGGGDGDTINITQNIAVGVAPTVRAEMARLLPQMVQMVSEAVADRRRRGGAFAG